MKNPTFFQRIKQRLHGKVTGHGVFSMSERLKGQFFSRTLFIGCPVCNKDQMFAFLEEAREEK